AKDHQEASAVLAKQSFDAAILDLQLSGKDGLAVALEIRSLPNCQTMPLMLLSAVGVGPGDTRPLETGVFVFIHKPIRPAQMLDALYRALSIQLQREKRAPVAPTLDGTFATRFPLRLLLADDNPINQKVGLSVLQKLGYRADVAQNGLEVLTA